MSFQASDLAAIDQALALGANEVRYADGRLVRYRTVADLMALRRRIAAELGVTLESSPRVLLAEQRR